MRDWSRPALRLGETGKSTFFLESESVQTTLSDLFTANTLQDTTATERMLKTLGLQGELKLKQHEFMFLGTSP